MGDVLPNKRCHDHWLPDGISWQRIASVFLYTPTWRNVTSRTMGTPGKGLPQSSTSVLLAQAVFAFRPLTAVELRAVVQQFQAQPKAMQRKLPLRNKTIQIVTTIGASGSP